MQKYQRDIRILVRMNIMAYKEQCRCINIVEPTGCSTDVSAYEEYCSLQLCVCDLIMTLFPIFVKHQHNNFI